MSVTIASLAAAQDVGYGLDFLEQFNWFLHLSEISREARTYVEGMITRINFQGTFRLAEAHGKANVKRKEGITEIEVTLKEMKPAACFGMGYSTYVLWLVSPAGHTKNVGEFILQGNRSMQKVWTSLQTFGMIVTAEPYSFVNSPSGFLVLENTPPAVNIINRVQVCQTKSEEFEWT